MAVLILDLCLKDLVKNNVLTTERAESGLLDWSVQGDPLQMI